MHYIIRDPGGREYGPVDLKTLIEWVRQGRVSPDTKIRNLTNGMMLMASTMPELDGMFQANHVKVASAFSGNYLYSNQSQQPAVGEHWEDYKFVILMSVLGLLSSMVVGWFAVIFNIFGMKRAWDASKEQKPMSGLAFSIALLSMLATLAIPFLMGYWLHNILFDDVKRPHKVTRGVDDK